jgi:cytochrome c
MRTPLRALAATAALALIATGAAADGEKKLAEKHLCLSCHKVEGVMVGPSFRDISKRYESDAEALAKLSKKVREGGKGTWGKIPMPANKDISDEEIGTVVRWVLAGARS